jgi:hypothetical protein
MFTDMGSISVSMCWQEHEDLERMRQHCVSGYYSWRESCRQYLPDSHSARPMITYAFGSD